MKKYFSYIIPISALMLTACGSDKETIEAPSYIVSVSMPQESEVTENSFNVTSTIEANGAIIVSSGFCYATTEKPGVEGTKVYTTLQDTAISATLTSLASGTDYYVRAYAITRNGDVTYSKQAVITTGGVNVTPAEVLAYSGPAYDDYYAEISGWESREQWNLANVHDPTVMLADDGYYYMYQTDASYGNAHDGHGHFHGRRSKDLINWEYLGATMDQVPAWVKEQLNSYRAELGLSPIDAPNYGYWAPVARNLGNGTYRMYYSIVIDNLIVDNSLWGERAFIGLMETTNPADNSSWVDKGMVVCSSSDRGTDWFGAQWEGAYFRYNAIDPTYVVTPEGDHWLVYGSWHSGFAGVQIDAVTGMPKNEIGKPWGESATEIAGFGQHIQSRNMASRWQGSEGPEIVYRNGYYYMFMAYDALDVAYNTRVVRSTSINGPYVGIDGTDVTNNGGDAYPIVTHPYKFDGDNGWVGISHCAVFEDGQDNWYFASQGRLPANVNNNPYSNALMMGQVRSIRWTKDGWPLVMPERYGNVPQVAISAAELAGEWENIDLAYEYAVQRESSAVVLGEDGTVTSGQWTGQQWSFDAANQILTIGNIDLYLQRECNWEGDRRATIVYAGLSADGRTTYWGKKK